MVEDSINHPLILLVDDYDTNVDAVSDYLTYQGYRVIVAKNGVEAIATVKAEQPDLILMDIQMPDMDGLEATRQIRAHPGGEQIPIIALTALAMPGDESRCIGAGANAYLSKPISLKELSKVVAQLINDFQG